LDSVRDLSIEDRRQRVPVHVVWELTLACNLKCRHCGSRAGRPRHAELSTAECLDVIRQLADLGTREISLIGGEAFIRKDWLTIIRAIADHGMDCSIQTGAYRLSAEMIRQARDAGLWALGVSLDGLNDLHDQLRGVRGSYAEALRVLEQARTLGLSTSVNTQITAKVIPQLHDLMHTIITAGVQYWQVQLTAAMGNAADNDELLIQPYDLLTLMPLLASLHRKGRRRNLQLIPGNNIGFFGPYETLWKRHYGGCVAGENVMGLEADGSIKGCPSLPTERYGAGNVREAPVAELWLRDSPMQSNKDHGTAALWGFCRTCRHADTCRGGCTWTADALFGRRGNNPYCHHRVLTLAEQGFCERLIKVAEAGPAPFATGRFKIVNEPLAGSLARDRHGA
jgi:radical SAM protein with 4Fe4S-binding SPASM domain